MSICQSHVNCGKCVLYVSVCIREIIDLEQQQHNNGDDDDVNSHNNNQMEIIFVLFRLLFFLHNHFPLHAYRTTKYTNLIL